LKNIIELSNITKAFPGVVANDNISLSLKKGEIHALLGENGAGKSTLMSVLFGLYQADKGEIRKNGNVVKINNPNDANELGIGMVHQHFKLVDIFTVLENIMLGVETTRFGFLDMRQAREKQNSLIEKYGLKVDIDAHIDDITVGMQQRVEILKMLYRENEILIFDEPTAVLTPQEIKELMHIMRNLKNEGKSILFITHKLNEIMEVADRCTVLRKGKSIATVEVSKTSKEKLSNMMVGRQVELTYDKSELDTKGEVLKVQNISVESRQHRTNAVKNVSFCVNRGEIVCIAGVDGNGQSELVYALTGLEKVAKNAVSFNIKKKRKLKEELQNKTGKEKFKLYLGYYKEAISQNTMRIAKSIYNAPKNYYQKAKAYFAKKEKSVDEDTAYGKIFLLDREITRANIRKRSLGGISHIPEDRHKFGLILDYTLEQNLILERYLEPDFQKGGFIIEKNVREYANKLIKKYDIRSGQGAQALVRSMSGGNQQKAIIAREVDKEFELLIAVQPTRGLDIGAIEFIHKQLLKQRDLGKGVLIISFELDEVMNLADRILVMHAGEIVGELKPKETTLEELGLYMAGAKRELVK
jgi:simple sugar transport system ATP-binding protein